MLFAVFLNEIRGVKFRKFVQTVTTLMGWDMYNEAGAPELKNLDDLLDCLKKIQDAQ